MTFFRSLRAKLTIWYAVLLSFTLLGSGGIAYFITREALIDNIDRSLKSEVKWVNEFIEPKAKKIRLKRAALKELQELKRSAQTPADEERDTLAGNDKNRAIIDDMWNKIYQHTLLSPQQHYIQILDRNGDLLYRSQSLNGYKLNYPDIPYQWINVVNAGGPDQALVRMALIQTDYVKIFVAYPMSPVYEVLDSIFYDILLIFPGALLISIVGGLFLAQKSLKPVDEITKAAKEITAQNLTRRLPPLKVDDELGRLTAQFNDMITRLQQSFAQIQRFSADASHELRTPLTIMRGELEVELRSERLSKHSRDILLSIYEEVLRLSSIVESLMLLVKGDTGNLSFDMKSVQLGTLIQDVFEDAQVLAESKSIELTLGPADAVTMIGDKTRLKQLFLNLLDNAMKYTPEHGNVHLAVQKTGTNVTITVQDNGIGIPADDLPKVFDRFYRVNRANSSFSGATGSGLGLSIAQWIVQAHQGTITVQSQDGKGTMFIVTLPLSIG